MTKPPKQTNRKEHFVQYQILYRASGFSTLKDGGNNVPAILFSSKEAALRYVRSCMARQIHCRENNLDAYRNKHKDQFFEFEDNIFFIENTGYTRLWRIIPYETKSVTKKPFTIVTRTITTKGDETIKAKDCDSLQEARDILAKEIPAREPCLKEKMVERDLFIRNFKSFQVHSYKDHTALTTWTVIQNIPTEKG